MELEVINDEKSNKLQLHFSKALNRVFNAFLRDLEITKSKSNTNVYLVDKIPAYDGFIENLQSLINSGDDWRRVNVFPIFEETHESITGRKFIIINIHYMDGTTEKKEPHIIFQLWENDAADLARNYGRLKYGENFVTISTAKKYIKEGRIIFEAKKIINQSIIDGLKKEKISDQSIVETEHDDTNSDQNNAKEVFEIVPEVEKDTLVIAKTIRPFKDLKSLTKEKEIVVNGKLIKNVLVPIAALEPFESGAIDISKKEYLKEHFPKLFLINDSNIEKATSIELFRFLQLEDHKKFGIDLSHVTSREVVNKKGRQLFKELGYPLHNNYPYVNIRQGYEDVSPLISIIHSTSTYFNYGRALAHWRPIADVSIAKKIINGLLAESHEELADTIKNKNKFGDQLDFKNQYDSISNTIRLLENSLQKIENYIFSVSVEQTKEADTNKDDYKTLSDSEPLAVVANIKKNGKTIQSVLVPRLAKQPFQSGDVVQEFREFYQTNFPELIALTDSEIPNCSSVQLFQLIQMEILPRFGITVSFEKVQQEFNKRAEQAFREIGFPIDKNYPYALIKSGDFLVRPLGDLLQSFGGQKEHWAKVVEFARPIGDAAKALEIVEKQIRNNEIPKQDQENVSPTVHLDLESLEKSRQFILDYLEADDFNETDNSTNELRHLLSDVISELLTIEAYLEGEEKTIIRSTVFDLENSQEQDNQEKLLIQLSFAISSFKDWVSDLSYDVQQKTIPLINHLIAKLENEDVTLIETISLSLAKDIKVHGNLIENVLVPQGANEPFESGNTYIGDNAKYKAKFPEPYKITVQDLPNISGLNLFRLSQLEHPQEYGIDILRRAVHDEIEHRGANLFEKIGFPTDMIYPYVNIHTGYDSVDTLEYVIDVYGRGKWWWAALENWRPVADISKAIIIVDNQIESLLDEQQQYINLRTGRPKTSKDNKEAYYNLDWKIESFKKSKTHLTDYLNHSIQEEQEETTTQVPVSNDSYIDRVIVAMHDTYMKGERLSKRKIENLQESTGTPSLGANWEAVELSWLLWYKRLYKLPLPFYDRLLKMDEFWKKLQPTYAYSDSSKELYKQYSTPCPIGAIIAQYTGMDSAQSIFEPSAGNGLLLVGANPSITHVNEVDKSRRKSLTYQRFSKISTANAALPFDKEMNKKYDVVVTNPPFAKWEDTKKEKAFIIREYFHNHRGMNHYIRLEHLMAGLALRTMKNNGRAAIIIMGHLSFNSDGTWKKYRPFFSWLYRHYKVDDVINMNSYKLYNKQGAVKETMLILIGGRKATPEGVQPNLKEQPQLDTIVSSFTDLWMRVKTHILPNIDVALQQLKIAVKQ